MGRKSRISHISLLMGSVAPHPLASPLLGVPLKQLRVQWLCYPGKTPLDWTSIASPENFNQGLQR